VATALQHETSTLSPRIQATSTGKHHPYGGQKNDALTFKPDQSVGAGHQIPDDYLRWTPYGMARALQDAGLSPAPPALTGGPFEAIAYCWAQALEYLPDDKRAEMSAWFYETHMPELMAWDAACDENKVRAHTAFPVAFSILAEKPQ